MRKLIWTLGLLALGCVRMSEQADHYACAGDGECPPGQACIAEMNETSEELGGLCGVGGTDCGSDDDCAATAKCVGAEEPDNDAPGKLGACVSVPPAFQCSKDADCRTDETCVPLTGLCAVANAPCKLDADCVEGQACAVNRQCVSMECSREAQCFPYTCMGGPLGCTVRCVIGADCAIGAHCDVEAQECVQNQ